MTRVADEFVRPCQTIFHFLIEDYGCSLVKVDRAVHAISVTYQNATTAVKISYEPFENAVFVHLVRLRNGEIPPYLGAPLNWVYLRNILALRAPHVEILRKPFDQPFTVREMRLVTNQYASALRQYADDVLRGDFSVFSRIWRGIRTLPKSGPATEEGGDG